MVPYLKGRHQTLDSWQDDRREDGWKMTAKEIAIKMEALLPEQEEDSLGEAPQRVKAVPRFAGDMEALTALFSEVRPPPRLIRSSTCLLVFYSFGDASAAGHAANFQGYRRTDNGSVSPDERIHYLYGHWCNANSEASWNYRELLNLVESLEAQEDDGRILDAEVFLFTDNLTTEAVFFLGQFHLGKPIQADALPLQD
jgi:hypothetical protein